MSAENKTVQEKDTSIVFSVSDPTGMTVHLYRDQWDHIKERHPEIKPLRKVSETIKSPDIIQHDDAKKTRIYTTITPANLHMNVFAGSTGETEYKVRTSYITGKLPKGDCIWQRPKK